MTDIPLQQGAKLAGLCVLVVEDNPFMQQVILAMLNRTGAEAAAASDGAEALEILAEEHFDCILMDLSMPVLDGFETALQIRAGTRLPLIPIIALSVSDTPENVQRCEAAGMNGFLSKPIDPAALVDAIDWLVRSQSQQALVPLNSRFLL